MKREREIDAARGLTLVWMTLTHLPRALTQWVNQPIGYIPRRKVAKGTSHAAPHAFVASKEGEVSPAT